MEDINPFWGNVERFSANAFHISLTLFLVYSPWFILWTIPLHSATNYIMLKKIKQLGYPKAEAIFLMISVFLFFVSLFIIERVVDL